VVIGRTVIVDWSHTGQVTVVVGLEKYVKVVVVPWTCKTVLVVIVGQTTSVTVGTPELVKVTVEVSGITVAHPQWETVVVCPGCRVYGQVNVTNPGAVTK